MSDTLTTQEIQAWIHRLADADESVRQSARTGLVTAAFERLQALARRMLRDYPAVRRGGEETGDVLSAAYQRLDRAMRDEGVLAQMRTPRDFLRLATLQVRRELRDLADRQRVRQRHFTAPPLPGDDASLTAAAPPVDETASPTKLALWSDFHRQVEQLPDDEREVFELLWYQELSQADAAQVIGVAEKTVQRRWLAARLRLHDLLGGELPF
jgi:RNA polymerase sigma factor (sigma-70 family)